MCRASELPYHPTFTFPPYSALKNMPSSSERIDEPELGDPISLGGFIDCLKLDGY